jgi:uncharacterized phage protein (TIGR01671 family)
VRGVREIEFRAWHKEAEFMFDVYGLSSTAVEEKRNGISYIYSRKNVVLMQYTGLKDKNGKKIYEGDIIRIRETKEDNWEIYVVKYYGDEGYPAFDTDPQINCDCNGLSYAMAACEVEIIGNIHDSPSLLEVE